MQTFSEDHSDLFFGRKKPTEEIFSLVKNNLLTIVFGKSGIGKSSLLNAGLIPKMRENFFLPILIRIPFADQFIDPLGYVQACIESEIRKFIKKDFTYPENLTLWQFFREADYTGGAIIPVLIFDQFEEYFRFGRHQKNTAYFIRQLSDLIENRVPDSIPEEDRKTITATDNRNLFRIVISLREDFLAPLEDLSREIPSLTKVRYRILQLHGKEAFEAVYFPARNLIDEQTAILLLQRIIPVKPATRPGETDTASVVKPDWEKSDFEPYILSLFCYQVNEKRIVARQDKISESIINQTKVETILSDYYDQSMSKYMRKYHKSFSPILEKNLISDEGYRLPKPASAREFSALSEQAISDLIDDRIIHKENRNEISYIEISHDLLAKVIYDRKIARHNMHKSYVYFGIALAAVLVLFASVYFVQEQSNYKRLQAYVDSLNMKNSKAAEDSATIDSLKTTVTTVVDRVTGDTSLSDPGTVKDNTKGRVTVYFQVNNNNAKQQSLLCIEALKKLNFYVPDRLGLPQIEVRKEPFQNSIKYFNKEDEANVALIKNICDRYYSKPLAIVSLVNSKLAGDYPIEIWVNYDPYYLQLFSSNAVIRKNAAEFMVSNYETRDSARLWPHNMILAANNDPQNKNGIYNVLVVFNNMNYSYLRSSKEEILAWLNQIEKSAGANTVPLIRSLRAKFTNLPMAG